MESKKRGWFRISFFFYSQYRWKGIKVAKQLAVGAKK